MLPYMTWMVYGANGYTGARVAERAVERGERPVLAGRSAAKVAPLAARLGLDHRVVDLHEQAALAAALQDIDVVAHCAGPFSATSAPMVRACLDTKTHYLDITGEIDVFEAIHARGSEAEEAGVVLVPGSGFDVVPTDCVAARLARAMPEATRLDLAFKAKVAIGPGTAKTAIEGAGMGGRERAGGRIRSVPLGYRQVSARFPSGPRRVTSIPWGDVSSAYRSTGIPDIATYTVVPAGSLLGKGQRVLAPLLRKPPVQRAAKKLAERVLAGGGQDDPAARAEIWGQVSDGRGGRKSTTLTTPNAIPLTADAVLNAVVRLRAGGVDPGAHTPSTAFGTDFALECDGVSAGEVS